MVFVPPAPTPESCTLDRVEPVAHADFLRCFGDSGYFGATGTETRHLPEPWRCRRVSDSSPQPFVAATAVAAVAGVVGVYLPWVRKLPAGYTDGTPYYTAEGVPGLTSGIGVLDVPILLLLAAVVVVVVASRGHDWLPKLVLVVGGVLVLLVSGLFLEDYWSGERYAVEPGLLFLSASGVLFVLVGAGGVARRVLSWTDASDG